jgi:osmoprotectant transport system permease protein
VNVVHEALRWLNDPLNWQGHDGVPYRTYEHLYITFFAVVAAAIVTLPLATWLGHSRRGGAFTVVVTNLSRAVPTLALLTVFATTAIGFGNRATIVALAVFAAPPLLANTYVGVRDVDADVIESARGMGMTEAQVLRRVELPLALPLIAAGIRTATVQVVATTTLAALVGGGGLGTIINLGFGVSDYGQVLAGGVLVAALSVIVEVTMGFAQRAATPGPAKRRRALRRTAADPAYGGGAGRE